METARIATWNICCDPHRGHSRLDTIIKRLTECSPDVVCLQEAWSEAAERLAAALNMTVAAHTHIDRPHGVTSDVAILTRWDVEHSHDEALPGTGDSGHETGYAYTLLTDPHGTRWIIHSAHLAWGSKAELTRARQAAHINQAADLLHTNHPDVIQVLTGDFNTLPESLTMRFLTGLDHVDAATALWVDAWGKVGNGPGWTSDPTLTQARDTALKVGILRPDLLPQRRIDYVMTYGYAHGRPGCPLSAHLISAEDASDHHGMWVELWRGNRR